MLLLSAGFLCLQYPKKAAEEPEPVVEMPKAEEITASVVAAPMEPTKAPEPWYKNESPVDFTACSAFCGLYYRSNLSKPFYSFEA